uniref:Ig-like domain-containing protein n=1 Tax=Scophthalmus maximus TaxID=52904 RepID=A0A8D3AKZ3_SCOMX
KCTALCHLRFKKTVAQPVNDCILPCSFRPTGTVVIHWYKQQIPVHSYYYNKDQFGLQNKHFSGRTGLFNSHIPHGNASLLLRRVKVQDRGRYKCYTSTRKENQEIFINLEVKGQYNATALHLIIYQKLPQRTSTL